MPRIRQNITTGEWTIVAPERASRPQHFAARPFSSHLMHEIPCEFCKGGTAWSNRIKDNRNTNFFVVPNKYPVFVAEDNIEEIGHDFYLDNASCGKHEVIVFYNPNESINLASANRLSGLLGLMQERAKSYEADLEIKSVVPIYNHGRESGASMPHPHAQMFASMLIPPRLDAEFQKSQQYFHHHEECLFCAMAKFELKENIRVVYKNRGAVAFTAFAPRFPFETWILPLHHHSTFTKASDFDLDSVAEALNYVLHSLDKKLANPPLNWFIHTARSADHSLFNLYHWHLEITPRLSNYGAYELATDTVIETMSPEMAAKYLR